MVRLGRGGFFGGGGKGDTLGRRGGGCGVCSVVVFWDGVGMVGFFGWSCS